MNATATPTAEQITLKAAQILKNLQDAGLDGYHGKLTAKQQKQLFGMVVFNNRRVSINTRECVFNTNKGAKTIRPSVGYRTDWGAAAFESLSLIAQRVLMNQPIRKAHQ